MSVHYLGTASPSLSFFLLSLSALLMAALSSYDRLASRLGLLRSGDTERGRKREKEREEGRERRRERGREGEGKYSVNQS